MIVLAAGNRSYHLPTVDALLQSVGQRTVIFAAASNDGPDYGRNFPAKCKEVIAIHSASYEGKHSRFNPAPEDNDDNFSVLGENVTSQWPRGIGKHPENTRSLSGTSTATSIAAAFAAGILSAVRLEESASQDGKESLLRWMRDHNGMRKVLRYFSKPVEGYDYLSLQHLPRLKRRELYKKLCQIKQNELDSGKGDMRLRGGG